MNKMDEAVTRVDMLVHRSFGSMKQMLKQQNLMRDSQDREAQELVHIGEAKTKIIKLQWEREQMMQKYLTFEPYELDWETFD